MKKLDNGFDEKLDNIKTLKWLPYIGKDYINLSSGEKLLIIGESHYLPNDTEDWYNDVKTRIFTREIFIMNQIKLSNDEMEKVLRNIQKILLNDNPSDDQKNKLWNSVSYYNFIQKELDSSKDRPIEGDYIIGWDTFFKVVEVLNPDYCLFCGVSAINNTGAMINAAEKNSFYQRFDDKEKFMSDGVKARKLSIGKNGKEILVLCIVHPCYRVGFTSSEWRKFIDQHLKDYTKWLRGN
jgi:hypothetical protein